MPVLQQAVPPPQLLQSAPAGPFALAQGRPESSAGARGVGSQAVQSVEPAARSRRLRRALRGTRTRWTRCALFFVLSSPNECCLCCHGRTPRLGSGICLLWAHRNVSVSSSGVPNN